MAKSYWGQNLWKLVAGVLRPARDAWSVLFPGTVTFQGALNMSAGDVTITRTSTGALKVEKATGEDLFTIDTTNNAVTLGSGLIGTKLAHGDGDTYEYEAGDDDLRRIVGATEVGKWSTSRLTLKAGGGNVIAQVGGKILTDTTSKANDAGVETTLVTHTIPANTLNSNNERILLRATVEHNAAAETRQYKVKFGGTTVADHTVGAGVVSCAMVIEVEIIRHAGGVYVVTNANGGGSSGTSFAYIASPTITLSNANDLVITETSTNNASVTYRFSTVQWG